MPFENSVPRSPRACWSASPRGQLADGEAARQDQRDLPQQRWGEPGAVSQAIGAGALDDELPAIVAAINARWAELARLRVERALNNITVGTRVAIGAEAQPKYLREMTGEVHEIDGDVVVVCLGAPVGRFKSE